MDSSHRLPRRLVLVGTVAVVLVVGGITTSWAAWKITGRRLGATTQVIDRSDGRFDVLVQRRPEALDTAGGQLTRPEGTPRLTPAQAFSIARGQRQPDGRKPSVRLATFSDADFPTPVGLHRRLVSRAKRALVWVVVVPDVPELEFGPAFGRQRSQFRCPSYTPVDAMTGEPLGTRQHC
jgi:hypothetical protein